MKQFTFFVAILILLLNIELCDGSFSFPRSRSTSKKSNLSKPKPLIDNNVENIKKDSIHRHILFATNQISKQLYRFTTDYIFDPLDDIFKNIVVICGWSINLSWQYGSYVVNNVMCPVCKMMYSYLYPFSIEFMNHIFLIISTIWEYICILSTHIMNESHYIAINIIDFVKVVWSIIYECIKIPFVMIIDIAGNICIHCFLPIIDAIYDSICLVSYYIITIIRYIILKVVEIISFCIYNAIVGIKYTCVVLVQFLSDVIFILRSFYNYTCSCLYQCYLWLHYVIHNVFNIIYMVIIPIVNTVKFIIYSIDAVWNVMTTTWQYIVGGLSGFIKAIEHYFTSFYTFVSSYLYTIYEVTKQIICNTFNMVIMPIINTVIFIFNQVIALVQCIIYSIDLVWRFMIATWQGIVDGVSGFIRFIEYCFTSVYEFIWSQLYAIYEVVCNTLYYIWSWTISPIINAIDYLYACYLWFYDCLKYIIQQTATIITTFTYNIIKTIVETLAYCIYNVIKGVNYLYTASVDCFAGITFIIKHIANNIKNDIMQVYNSLIQFTQFIYYSVKSFCNYLSRCLYDVLFYIIQNISTLINHVITITIMPFVHCFKLIFNIFVVVCNYITDSVWYLMDCLAIVIEAIGAFIGDILSRMLNYIRYIISPVINVICYVLHILFGILKYCFEPIKRFVIMFTMMIDGIVQIVTSIYRIITYLENIITYLFTDFISDLFSLPWTLLHYSYRFILEMNVTKLSIKYIYRNKNEIKLLTNYEIGVYYTTLSKTDQNVMYLNDNAEEYEDVYLWLRNNHNKNRVNAELFINNNSYSKTVRLNSYTNYAIPVSKNIFYDNLLQNNEACSVVTIEFGMEDVSQTKAAQSNSKPSDSDNNSEDNSNMRTSGKGAAYIAIDKNSKSSVQFYLCV